MCGGGRFTGALTVQRAFINTTNCHSHPEWFYRVLYFHSSDCQEIDPRCESESMPKCRAPPTCPTVTCIHAASRRSVLPLLSVVSFPLILADDVPHDPKPPESGHIGSPAAYLAAGDESVFVSSLIASIRAPLFSLVLVPYIYTIQFRSIVV